MILDVDELFKWQGKNGDQPTVHPTTRAFFDNFARFRFAYHFDLGHRYLYAPDADSRAENSHETASEKITSNYGERI